MDLACSTQEEEKQSCTQYCCRKASWGLGAFEKIILKCIKYFVKRRLGVDGRVLNGSQRNEIGRCGLNSAGSVEPVAGSYERSNEPSGFINSDEFLD
jgi:hypothetical protein